MIKIFVFILIIIFVIYLQYYLFLKSYALGNMLDVFTDSNKKLGCFLIKNSTCSANDTNSASVYNNTMNKTLERIINHQHVVKVGPDQIVKEK